MPKVTIVITSFNNERYLTRTIESVFAQTYRDFELFVIDDDSSDGSPALLERLVERYPFTLIRNPYNLNPRILRQAYALGTGEYFCILHSDDYWQPDHLADLVDLLEQNREASLAFSRLRWVDENDRPGEVLHHPGVAEMGGSYSGGKNEFVDLVRFDNYIPPSAALFRRHYLLHLFDTHGKIEDIYFADLMVNLRVAQQNNHFAFSGRPTLMYRVHSGQASHRFAQTSFFLDLALKVVTYALEDGRYRQELRAHGRQIMTMLEGKFRGSATQVAERHLQQLQWIGEQLGVMAMISGPRVPALSWKSADESGPDFSIIVPTYNRPEFLSNALRSILEQTYRSFEVIVVNDAGCDVEQVISALNQSGQILYLRQPRNMGLSAARNAALRVARGRYLVNLDDDDMMLPDHLAVLLKAHQENPGSVVYTDATIVSEVVDRGLRKETGRGNPYRHGVFDRFRLRVTNYIPVNTWSCKRWMYERIGGFDENLSALEDWDVLLRLSSQFEFVHIPQITVEVRTRPRAESDNMCAREAHRMRDLHLHIYAKYDHDDGVGLQAARQQLMQAMLGSNRDRVVETEIPQDAYALWRNSQQVSEIKAEAHAVRMLTQWKHQPLVTLFTVVDSSNLAHLAATVDGLQKQLYKHWRLIVLSDLPCVDPVFQQSDFLGWMELSSVADHGLLAQALNTVLGDLPCDWVALMPPGTVLAPEAMLKLGDYAEMHPEWSVIYTDHDTVISEEVRVNPQFKPDFNLDMLLAKDYVGTALWFRFDVLARLGGFPETCYAFHYDLVLQAADAFGDGCIGHIADVGFGFPPSLVAGNEEARIHAVSRFLERNRLDAEILPGYTEDSVRIDYRLAEPPPHVSIIIPTQERLEYLEPCIASILTKTSYPAFDIVVVDGGSEDPDLLAYYDDLAEQHQDRVSVISLEDEFELATAYHAGIAVARGGLVLLMANDTECVQEEWLGRLVSVMQRADVGAAGPRLLMPESAKIYSAGLILGVGGDDGVAGHAFQGEDIRSPGYMSRALLTQSYSALAADCLLLSRAALDEIGGVLDANMAPGTLWNVDLGLRLIGKGYRLVFTPFSNVVTQGGVGYAPASTDLEVSYRLLKRSQQSAEKMLARWHRSLATDAAYSRHLSLVGKPFNLEVHASATWDLNLRDKPRLLGVALAGGSGVYRLTQPFAELSHQGRAHGTILKSVNGKPVRLPTAVELERMDPDTVYFQNSLGDVELRWLEKMKGYRPDTQFICSLDDLIVQIPAKSSVYYHFQKHFRDAKPKLRRALTLFDRLVVSTQPLADYCSDMIDDIVMVPNTLDRGMWGELTSLRGTSRKPRVGWVGAQQHLGDLTLVFEVVKELADEVDWVFMGMCPDEIRPYVKEAYTDWVAYEKYPAKMASLNLDLAIAPLEVNPFNEAKSNLRLLEYGALGWPVVCSDIYPYRTDDAPVARVPNTTAAWLSAIRDRIHDLDASYAEGDRLRHWVQRYWLDERAGEWFDALNGKKS
nr:glycosyltransferase [uncultured Pseudogulbenkiania sp.]